MSLDDILGPSAVQYDTDAGYPKSPVPDSQDYAGMQDASFLSTPQVAPDTPGSPSGGATALFTTTPAAMAPAANETVPALLADEEDGMDLLEGLLASDDIEDCECKLPNSCTPVMVTVHREPRPVCLPCKH